MFDFLQARRRALGIAAISAFSLLLLSCGGGDAPTPPMFGTMAVVGASGTDTGNRCGVVADPLCFPVPPYAGKSTAANGKLFNEIVAAHYGAPMVASSAGGTNYAIGGARTGVIPGDTTPATILNLQIQLDLYLQKVNYQIAPQTLVIIDGSTFGNNIERVLQLLPSTPPAQQTPLVTNAVAAAVGDIFALINRAYAAGARNILLVNSSNLGLHPAVAAAGPVAVATATAMSNGYNGALTAQVVPQVRAGYAGLNLYYVDFGKLSNDVVANPSAFGFTNTTAPCYPFFSAPAAPVCANPSQYVFWDELHPGASMHALAAQLAIAAIGP